jgi:hypothetical protein
MPQHSSTPVTFSTQETQEIREMLRILGERPVCPLCGRDLVAESSMATVASVTWHVRCKPCRRAAIITVVRNHGTAPDK